MHLETPKLYDVELNRAVCPLYKDLELPICSDGSLFFFFSRYEIGLCELPAAYCLDDFLTCFALQGMPSLYAHSRVLCKNETRKYRNETGIHMINA